MFCLWLAASAATPNSISQKQRASWLNMIDHPAAPAVKGAGKGARAKPRLTFAQRHAAAVETLRRTQRSVGAPGVNTIHDNAVANENDVQNRRRQAQREVDNQLEARRQEQRRQDNQLEERRLDQRRLDNQVEERRQEQRRQDNAQESRREDARREEIRQEQRRQEQRQQENREEERRQEARREEARRQNH